MNGEIDKDIRDLLKTVYEREMAKAKCKAEYSNFCGFMEMYCTDHGNPFEKCRKKKEKSTDGTLRNVLIEVSIAIGAAIVLTLTVVLIVLGVVWAKKLIN